jgi:hypothetical protein
MDLFEEEILLFLKHLNAQEVRYILVGGIAVNYHGFNRSTGDIDLWLDNSKSNRVNFVQALKNYGIEGAEIFMSSPFIAGYTELMLDNGISIDLMADLQFFKKENFESCYENAKSFELTKELTIKILNLNTLIEEKEKSSRPKDKLDADTLKKLYRL